MQFATKYFDDEVFLIYDMHTVYDCRSDTYIHVSAFYIHTYGTA